MRHLSSRSLTLAVKISGTKRLLGKKWSSRRDMVQSQRTPEIPQLSIVPFRKLSDCFPKSEESVMMSGGDDAEEEEEE